MTGLPVTRGVHGHWKSLNFNRIAVRGFFRPLNVEVELRMLLLFITAAAG
jgi:hypothetical protein